MEVSGVGLVCLSGFPDVALPFVWVYLAVGERSVGEEGGGDAFWVEVRVESEF